MSDQDYVWLIADVESGEPSLIRHGVEGDEPNWRRIGPFVYTQEAEALAAAENPRFLPKGVVGSFKVVPVERTVFVQDIFNGFPPTHPDVFILDGSLFPLTYAGALWIDIGLGTPIWEPIFDEDGGGLKWLDTVLIQVAKRINLSMETIGAIGAMNAAAEDVGQSIKETTTLIHQNVKIVITPEEDSVGFVGDVGELELSPAVKFWLHTKGMPGLGKPELEFRNVPAQWVTAAGAELNGWAAYFLQHQVKAGDFLEGGGPVPLIYRAIFSPDKFWDKGACMRLELSRVLFQHDPKEHEYPAGGGPQIH